MEKMDTLIVLGAVALAIVLLLAVFGGAVMETGSWGLCFQTPGTPPSGPADTDTLRKFDGAYLSNTEEPVLYLTFDAGYENGYTAQILDILKEREVPGAFFLVGDYLERNPDLVRRMTEEGHIVGNHTMDHPDMSGLSGDAFAAQLGDMEALYEDITGQTLPKFYRPPQGLYSEENLKQAQELGYQTVFWSLAYADWDNDNQPDPDAAVEKLTGRLHDGAVILLHATSKTNAEILDRMIGKWQEMGYRFAPLTELFD